VSLAIGQVAPDFTTRNQHGETIRLEQLRGRPVVLIFYPWAFSGICTGELRVLRDSQEVFRRVGARLVAVSCDAMFTLRAFADAEGLDFDLLTDHWPHGGIAERYGVFDDQAGCSLRGTFVIDAEGVVCWSVVNGIGEPREIADLVAGLAA
jgi:peroxiredoxin